ncbi:uncharacterized protein FIESC28_04960 [Fusarium coffeatum]|uniref:Uncharacterized protein n=1 Tax=Fusarium coffeatum TaxID=231269 RepID=A0A366RWG4_9HYPO|nr:uncharacterized protein FIESC28_04960 [Fusarium coffeatum]RBR21423.1 hypothetical protein FIESC28_04960 [Fusarium coffeatum]
MSSSRQGQIPPPRRTRPSTETPQSQSSSTHRQSSEQVLNPGMEDALSFLGRMLPQGQVQSGTENVTPRLEDVYKDIERWVDLCTRPVQREESEKERKALIGKIKTRLGLEHDFAEHNKKQSEAANRQIELNNQELSKLMDELAKSEEYAKGLEEKLQPLSPPSSRPEERARALD